MPTFASYDGTNIAYHVAGHGPAVVCLPGGPGSASEYLGDLGGLSRAYTVIRIDHRGTGDSDVPSDVGSYRLDRLVLDVEALRVHLGLEKFRLVGHSAGSNVAVVYAGMYRERLERFVLLAGLPRIVGVKPLGMEAAYMARSQEPWFAEAMAAGDALEALPGDATPEQRAPLLATLAHFSYGRWDEAAAAHAAAGPGLTSTVAREGFYAGYQADPMRLAAQLGAVAAPVLIVAGELDIAPTPEAAIELAKLFPKAEVSTIAGSGHYPWLDNPAALLDALSAFLG